MPVDDHALAECVTDLEVRLAYQDRALRELDDVVRGLFARIEALETELRELRKAASATVETSNEAPPHY